MNKIYFLLLASILAFSIEGRVFRVIDNFSDASYLARFVPSPAETYDNTAPFYWFSPYANPVGHGPGAPFANFRTATNVIGGQRDVIIGHYSTMETLASVSCYFNQKMQIAFPTSFVGSVYVQYDGVDNGSGLGARLGNNIGGDAGAGSNADGTVDFTFGGQARGIQFSINSDLPISVELKVKNLEDDSTVEDFGNSLTVTVQNNEILGFTRYYFTFDDSAWSDSTFDWTRVAGFQFKVFTEPGSPTIQSTDVEVISIQIGAFTVGGTVSNDCLCDNASLGPLAGTRVNLFDTSVSTTEPLAFTTTDANGDYSFSQEFSSTSGFLSTTTPYRICLDDTSLVRCSGTQPSNANGCYDFFTSGNPYVDLLDFDFTIARTILLEIPSPVNNVECGVGSTDPSNTGYAFVTDCDGIRTQLNVWSDVVTGSNCVRNIIRTWTDTNSNQSGTQLIRVIDTLPPVFNVPVQSLSQPCDSVTISLSQWLNNQGNAVVTDACAAGLVTFTNNYSGQPLTGCGTSATVTFTFHDGCGRFATQTATYTIEEAVSAEPCVPICGSIEENTVNNAQLTVEGQGVGFNLATSCAASPYAIFTFNSGSFNYVFLSTASYGGSGSYDLFLQKQGVNQCNPATQFKAYGRLLQTTVDQNSVYYIYVGLGAETNPNSGFLLQGSVAPPPQNDLCTNAIDIGTLIQDESIYVSGTTIGATNGDGQAGMSSSVYYNFFSGEVEDIFVTTCYPGSTTFDITIHVGYNNLADTNTCPGGYEGCFWECGHNLHYGVDISCPPEGNTQAGYGVYRDSIPLQRNRNYFIEVGRHPYARGNEFGTGDFTFVIGSGTLCIPNCAGKQCGDNGCGGQCGTCANDESCNAQGTCEITQVLPVTLATAVELTILPNSDQTINVNNVYDVSTENPESPNDPCFTGTSNPIWYHIAPSVYQRTITISTCDTLVDTVIGAFLPDGTRIECNDDRDSSAPAGDCNGSSSYIQFINNPNTDFYIVISSFSPSDTGDIDLRIESRIEIEDLIEESTTIIVNSLIQQVATLTGDLTNQISAVNSNVDAQVGSVLSAIGTLSTSVDNQFTQVGGSITALQQAIQTDIATCSSSLSSQISALSGLLSDTPDSLPAIAATVGTISANVASLQNDVDSLTGDVSAVNGVVTTISGTLNVVSSGVSDLDSDIESLSADLDEQSSLIGTLQTNVGNGISSVNNNIDSLSDSVTAEFGGVTDSLTAINGIALNILEDVSEGNVVGNNIYNFIRSAYYETYLLAGSNALDSIPWKWRTPAAANGSMDDILAYLTSLYNSKLAACQGVSNTNCNSFRQNATPAFSSLLTSYNNQVSALKYKKAFQVLQGFYSKLFPTTLWV